MTLGQLQQSAIRYIDTGDLASASAATLQEICAAINGGIADAYALAPHVHSVGKVSETLPGITVQDVQLTAGSNILTGTDIPFSANWIGRTLTSGDFVTQITGVNSVLHDALTDSSGVLVYGDAVAVPDAVVRFTGYPFWQSPRSTEGHYLQAADLMADSFTPTTGEPLLYQSQPLGTIAGATVKSVLRVWPAPDAAGELTIEAQLTAPRYSLTDSPDTELPFHVSWSEYVTAATIARLVISPMWKQADLRSVVMEHAARAAATFRATVPQTLAPADNRINPYPQFGRYFLKL